MRKRKWKRGKREIVEPASTILLAEKVIESPVGDGGRVPNQKKKSIGSTRRKVRSLRHETENGEGQGRAALWKNKRGITASVFQSFSARGQSEQPKGRKTSKKKGGFLRRRKNSTAIEIRPLR